MTIKVRYDIEIDSISFDRLCEAADHAGHSFQGMPTEAKRVGMVKRFLADRGREIIRRLDEDQSYGTDEV